MKCSALLPDAQVKAVGRRLWLLRHWLRPAAVIVLGVVLAYGFIWLDIHVPCGTALNAITAFSFTLLPITLFDIWVFVPCRQAGEDYKQQYQEEHTNG
jgi:hypothetical protein